MDLLVTHPDVHLLALSLIQHRFIKKQLARGPSRNYEDIVSRKQNDIKYALAISTYIKERSQMKIKGREVNSVTMLNTVGK